MGLNRLIPRYPLLHNYVTFLKMGIMACTCTCIFFVYILSKEKSTEIKNQIVSRTLCLHASHTHIRHVILKNPVEIKQITHCTIYTGNKNCSGFSKPHIKTICFVTSCLVFR